MNKLKRAQFYLIIILFLIFFYFKFNRLFKDNFYNDDYSSQIIKMKDDEISIIVNIKNLTKDKHILLYEIMKKLNTTRNYYFINTDGKPLNGNLSKIVENNSVKIVQSNFPDSIFLPLVVSLYGKTVPELVLLIEGEELINNTENNLPWSSLRLLNEENSKFFLTSSIKHWPFPN